MIHFLPNPAHSTKVSAPLSSLSCVKRDFLLFGLLLIACGTVASCATALKQPSPVAVKADEIEQELETLTISYQEKEATTFFSRMHPLFKWPPFFKESVEHDFAIFSEIKMNMKISRIEIASESVKTGIYWEGNWKKSSTGLGAPPLRQSGQAIFIFSTESPPRLLEIRGESPFGVSQKSLAPADKE